MKGYKLLTFSGSDPALSPYKNMIYSYFMSSLRSGNSWFKEIEATVYKDVYHRVIESLLSRSLSTIRLAVLPDDPDTCIGWSLSENEKTVHYVFVKSGIDARRRGIGTDLLPKDFETLTHLTKNGICLWKNKFPQAKFNPFLS